MKSTGIVRSAESAIAPIRTIFLLFIVNTEPFKLLMSHAWSISHTQSVMNAIVVPASGEVCAPMK